MATIELANIEKHFGNVRALEPTSLSVADGEFVALLGPSGCGKTTTLNIVAGLESPTAGAVRIDGADETRVPATDRNLAMVFQSYALYPHLTVRRNIAFPLEVRGQPSDRIARAVETAAERLGLGPYLDRYPRALSGGQRQRVALGRALVRAPRAFLLDEPLSNLDAVLRLQMRDELAGLFRELRATALYVTHDQAEAMTMADRIAVFQSGQLLQFAAPLEVYRAPSCRFVASFVGAPPMSFLPATIADGHVQAGEARFPAPPSLRQSPGTRVELGLRPEDVAPDSAGQPARVVRVEHLGGHQVVVLAMGGGTIRMSAPATARFAPDEAIRFRVAARDLYVFHPETGRTLAAPGLPTSE